MSFRRALLLSLLALLREDKPTGLGLKPGEVDLAWRGIPPASAGKWFWGLHGGGVNCSTTTSYEERPTITLTLTARVNEPADKIGPALVEADAGVEERLAGMRAFLVRSQIDWCYGRTGALLGAGVQHAVEPFFAIQESDAREVSPEWWRAGPATPSQAGQRATLGPAGLAADLTLTGFRRESYIESAT